MARKHSKPSIKQSVTRVVIKPAVTSRERIVREVPEGTDGALPITQDDGTTKFFVVSFKEVSPAVVKFVANGPTTKRGAQNKPPEKKSNAGGKK